MKWFRRKRKGSGRFVFKVTTSEASGPSGAGSRIEGRGVPRADSGIELKIPRFY